MSAETLLPCPFCGAPARGLTWQDDNSVACSNQDCEVSPVTQNYSTREQAIAVWNTRSENPDAALMRLALAKIACFEDDGANAHLRRTGKYFEFDEPWSCKIARDTLAKLHHAANAQTPVAETATTQPRPSQ